MTNHTAILLKIRLQIVGFGWKICPHSMYLSVCTKAFFPTNCYKFCTESLAGLDLAVTMRRRPKVKHPHLLFAPACHRATAILVKRFPNSDSSELFRHNFLANSKKWEWVPSITSSDIMRIKSIEFVFRHNILDSACVQQNWKRPRNEAAGTFPFCSPSLGCASLLEMWSWTSRNQNQALGEIIVTSSSRSCDNLSCGFSLNLAMIEWHLPVDSNSTGKLIQTEIFLQTSFWFQSNDQLAARLIWPVHVFQDLWIG